MSSFEENWTRYVLHTLQCIEAIVNPGFRAESAKRLSGDLNLHLCQRVYDFEVIPRKYMTSTRVSDCQSSITKITYWIPMRDSMGQLFLYKANLYHENAIMIAHVNENSFSRSSKVY